MKPRIIFAIIACVTMRAAVPCVAATRTVSNLNDSGAGSLRDNIAASLSGDTITFSVSGTITLISGELLIGRSLTIIGPAGGISVSGNNASRVFNIAAGTVRISNLSIIRGHHAGARGADGQTSGHPGGDGVGGGVLNSGTLTLSGCTLSANAPVGGGGGASLSMVGGGGDGGSGLGGAILNQGTVTLLNCTINANSSLGGAGHFGEAGGNGGSAYVMTYADAATPGLTRFGTTDGAPVQPCLQ